MLILCKAWAYRLRSLCRTPTGGCRSEPFRSIPVHEKEEKTPDKKVRIFLDPVFRFGAKISSSLRSITRVFNHFAAVHGNWRFLCVEGWLQRTRWRKNMKIYRLCHWNSFVHERTNETLCVCVVWAFDEWIGILTAWGWKWTALLPQETVSVLLFFSLSFSGRLNDMPHACELLSRTGLTDSSLWAA